MLDERAAALRRQYIREWRKRNPEKVRQYNQDYWIRRAERETALVTEEGEKTDGIDNE